MVILLQQVVDIGDEITSVDHGEAIPVTTEKVIIDDVDDDPRIASSALREAGLALHEAVVPVREEVDPAVHGDAPRDPRRILPGLKRAWVSFMTGGFRGF